MSNPNTPTAPRPRSRTSARRNPADNIAQFANQTPNVSQASPTTAGNVGSMMLPEDQQLNLAAQMETMHWAGSFQRSFQALEDADQRREALRELNEDEIRTLMQYGAITQEDIDGLQEGWRKWLLQLSPHNAIRNVVGGLWDAMTWVDEQKNAAWRSAFFALENEGLDPDQLRQENQYGRERVTGAIEEAEGKGFLGRWRVYWNLAKNNPEGNFRASRMDSIAERNGWDFDTRTVLARAGDGWRKNYLPEGPEGQEMAKTLTTSAINDMVFEGLLDSEQGLDLQGQMSELLDDPEQVAAFEEMLGEKLSPGREFARLFGLDADQQSKRFSFVSGGIDTLWAFVDPFLAAGRVRKGIQVARHGVSSVDDMIRVGTNQTDDFFQELAVRQHNGNVSEAAASYMAANPDQVKPGMRRMAERIQRSWNEDLQTQAARMRGEAPSTQGGYRQLYKEDPSIAAYSQDLWQAQVRYEQGIRGTDAIPGRAQRGASDAIRAEQAADGIEIAVKDVGVDAVYRAMMDDQTVRRIVNGHYSGHVRAIGTAPMLTHMNMAKGEMKVALRAQIDWLNDSNYRMVKRLVDKGKFADEAAEEAVLRRAGAFMGRGNAVGGTIRVWDSTENVAKKVKLDDLSLADRAHMMTSSVGQAVGTLTSYFTRQMPGDRVFNVMEEDAVRQVESLATMLPKHIGDDIVNRFASATEVGERVLIMRGLFAEMFARNGVFDHAPGQAFALKFLDTEMFGDALNNLPEQMRKRFAEEAGHIYSVGDLDRIAVDGAQRSGAALFGFQTSQSVAVPDFRRFFSLSRRQAFWSNVFGVQLWNSKAMETAISKVWAPAVLLRLGFPLRAGGEEAMQFVMREGGAAYMKGFYLSRIAGKRIRRRRLASGKKDITYVPKGGAKSEYWSVRDMPDEIKLPWRRGNAGVLWAAQQVDRVFTPENSWTQKFIHRASDHNRFLGMSFLGNWLSKMDNSAASDKVRWGIGIAHDKWLGDRGLRAIEDLIKATDGEYVTKYMGDISSSNFGRKFYETQLSGGTKGMPSGAHAGAAVANMGDEDLLREVYDYRWGKFALESDFGYEHYEKFLWQVSQSDDPLDKFFFEKLSDIQERILNDPEWVDLDVITQVRANIPEMVKQIQDDPELYEAFARMARSAVAPRNREETIAALATIPGHSERKLLPTKTDNGEVLFWHGTRTPMRRENVVSELLDSQGEVSEAVRRVHRYRIDSQHLQFVEGELQQLNRIFQTATDDAADALLTQPFQQALRDASSEQLAAFGISEGQARVLLDGFDAGGVWDPYYWNLDDSGSSFLRQQRDVLGTVDSEGFVREVAGDKAARDMAREQGINSNRFVMGALENEGDRSMRTIRARFAGQLDQQNENMLDDLAAYRDRLSDTVVSKQGQLDEEAVRIFQEDGIDLTRLGEDAPTRELTVAERERLTEIAEERQEILATLDDLDRQSGDLQDRIVSLRDSAEPGTSADEISDGADTLDELMERQREIDQLISEQEFRDYNLDTAAEQIQAQQYTPAMGKNDLSAIALQDRRFVDSGQGTGGQWYGNGMYATDDINEALDYSLLRQDAAEAPRLYGIGFEGEWRSLDLNADLPDDVVEMTSDLMYNLMGTVDGHQFERMLSDPAFRWFYDRSPRFQRLAEKRFGVLGTMVDEVPSAPSGEQTYRFFDMLRNNLFDTDSWIVNRNTSNQQWLEAVDTFQSGLERLGYTGFRHGTFDEASNFIVFDSNRIKVLSEWSSDDVTGYAAKHISKEDALQASLEARAAEIQMRSYFYDAEGKPTRPLTESIYVDMYNGEIPRAETIQRLNHTAQEKGELVEYDLRRLMERVDRNLGDVYVPSGFMGPGTPPDQAEKYREAYDKIDRVLLKWQDRFGLGGQQGSVAVEKVRLDPDLADDFFDELYRAIDDSLPEGRTPNLLQREDVADLVGDFDPLDDFDTVADAVSDNRTLEELQQNGTFVREKMKELAGGEAGPKRIDGGEHLWEDVIAPLSKKQKRDLAQLFWARPFRMIGGVIDGVSRHPAWFYHYTEGMERTADIVFTHRKAERQIIDVLEETLTHADRNPAEYSNELLRRVRQAKENITVKKATGLSSPATVNPQRGVVHVDRDAMAQDLADDLKYLFGGEQGVGSRQKAEVMARLAIDREELVDWMRRSGGTDMYERFVVETQRAHRALGHKGIIETDWMKESAIHENVEATWVALERIGAGFLADRPMRGADIFDLRKTLQDIKASHRRMQNELVASGGNKRARLIEELLEDHPEKANIDRLMDIAKENGFKKGADETEWAFRERVIERLYDAKQDHVEQASTYAFNMTRPHVDSVAIASFGQTLMRNAMPFQWAHERFIKRSINTLIHSPESMKRLHLMYNGLRNVGIVHTDERTGNDYFVYPGTNMAYDGIAKVVKTVFGSSLRRVGIVDDAGNELPEDLNLNEYLRLQAQPYLSIPGLDDIGRPYLGPQFAVALKYIRHRFPRVAGIDTQQLSEQLVGPIASNDQRPAWSLITPSVVTNTYRAMNPYEEMASDSITALQVLAANDMLPDDTNPASWEEFNDRLEEQMKIIGWMRVVYGWLGIAPPEVRFDGSEKQNELIELLQNYSFDEAYSQFVRNNPDVTAWQVFGTETVGGASIPATQNVWEFLNAHPEMDDYKYAASYVVPRPTADDGTDDFYQPAWAQQFAMDLRVRKDTEQMYREMRYAETAPMYFEERREYQMLREQVKGTPAAAQLDLIWARRSLEFKTQFPTFWNELTSNERQLQRNRVVSELNAMIENEDVPVTNSSEATFTLLQGYNEFQQAMNSVKGINNREAREYRAYVRRQLAQWAYSEVQKNPAGQSFYYRIIMPELSLPDEEVEMMEQMIEQQLGANDG